MKKRQETKQETIERHKQMSCKTYELKIDKSKLSVKSLNHLTLLFREAKWYYNYCISRETIKDIDTKLTICPVKVKDVFENRELSVLSSQMKQEIKVQMITSCKSLKTKKNKKIKIGKLKFKSFKNSIPLIQLNNTYYINKENNTIKIQLMKQWLKVKGLNQIPELAEICNAKLIRKSNNYYLHITTYQTKENINKDYLEKHKKQKPIAKEAGVGIDFGCITQMTITDTSYNTFKLEFQVPTTEKIKQLDRRIMKKVDGKEGKNRGSSNRRKLQAERRKEYENLTNKKTDIRNKIVNILTSYYKYVVFQDESIKGWKASGHGKAIQNSGIGSVLSDLKQKSVIPILVDKFFPSTQLCPKCKKKNKLSQSERVYSCECGYIEDRDTKSSSCILYEGLDKYFKMTNQKFSTEYREKHFEEILPSVILSKLEGIPGLKVSKVESLSQEASAFRRR